MAGDHLASARSEEPDEDPGENQMTVTIRSDDPDLVPDIVHRTRKMMTALMMGLLPNPSSVRAKTEKQNGIK